MLLRLTKSHPNDMIVYTLFQKYDIPTNLFHMDQRDPTTIVNYINSKT